MKNIEEIEIQTLTIPVKIDLIKEETVQQVVKDKENKI